MAPILNKNKKKPNHLTLKQKAKILDEIKIGVSFSRLSFNYNVLKSTISRVAATKLKITEDVSNTFSGSGKRKYIRRSEYPIMEQKLYQWFLKQRARNVSIGGNQIKYMARKIHDRINKEASFNASDGWFSNFKKRFGIRRLAVVGEKLSSQAEYVQPFKNELELLIKRHHLTEQQLYNADETGLFWKILPNKTFVSATEKTAPGRKLSKERLTFLACTNATGDHKLKPLIIGKSKNPRCFKNFVLPVEYANTKKAWMNCEVFRQWFHNSFVPQVCTYVL